MSYSLIYVQLRRSRRYVSFIIVLFIVYAYTIIFKQIKNNTIIAMEAHKTLRHGLKNLCAMLLFKGYQHVIYANMK